MSLARREKRKAGTEIIREELRRRFVQKLRILSLLEISFEGFGITFGSKKEIDNNKCELKHCKSSSSAISYLLD